MAQAARTDTTEKLPAKSKMNNLPLIIYAVLLVFSLAGALELTIVQGGILRYLRWLPVGLCLLLMVIDFLKRRPEHPFWNVKFLFFIFILIPVQTLFAHNWLTIPYYIDRAFHGSTVGANFEFFSNLNPILIFFLTPIVAAFTAKVNVYKMMIIGTFTMALPTFLLVLGPNPVLLLIFILFLSIGEAMWQPRFLQWVAEIAPPGQTGAYMGIAQFPWFLTKVVTGLYSGWLLTRYCPKPGNGEQHTEILWLIYAFIALISPIMLLLARNWMLAFRSGPAAAK
ncbi:hypothetical protein L0128_19325 [candidate division KSB1 bacterium]|nr:hypothetical protein [candidate division KSB1 bacterium]